jgi:pimeloyl-ACP methyl ester carboxylesterase
MVGARRRRAVRRSGGLRLLWRLLGVLGLGLLAAILWSRRRGFSLADLENDFAPPPPPAAEPPEGLAGTGGSQPAGRSRGSAPDVAVWIAGPSGNLFVRDGGAGSGRLPILFVHSLGGNGGQWALQLDHLRRSRRAAALDLRGHGDSDPADDGDYSIAALAGDVAAAADQLGLRRFVLAGHSLGGSVAIEYAGRHPERVAGLLLVDPNGDQSRIPKKEAASFLRAIAAAPLAEMDWYFRQILVNGEPSASRWVLEDLRLTDEAAISGAVESSFRYAPLPALARFGGPRLSVVSDMNSLPLSLHNLAGDLPVHLIPGTGHWLQMDRPAVFNRIVDDFLAAAEAAL